MARSAFEKRLDVRSQPERTVDSRCRERQSGHVNDIHALVRSEETARGQRKRFIVGLRILRQRDGAQPDLVSDLEQRPLPVAGSPMSRRGRTRRKIVVRER